MGRREVLYVVCVVQMISNCLHGSYGSHRGEGVGTLRLGYTLI
jgi:hypothetical protein